MTVLPFLMGYVAQQINIKILEQKAAFCIALNSNVTEMINFLTDFAIPFHFPTDPLKILRSWSLETTLFLIEANTSGT